MTNTEQLDKVVQDIGLETMYQEIRLYKLVTFIKDGQFDIPADIQRLIVDVELGKNNLNSLNSFKHSLEFQVNTLGEK